MHHIQADVGWHEAAQVHVRGYLLQKQAKTSFTLRASTKFSADQM